LGFGSVIVLFEGHLSYEVPLVNVLQQVLTSQMQGATVLQLADPLTGARGDILINDSRVLVGAQMYEPKAMGYPALKTLCAFALADFRLVQPDAAKANRGDHSLNLDIERILDLIPNLPEDPNHIENPLERIFNNNDSEGFGGPVEPNMARLDPDHASGIFPALPTEVVPAPRTEVWKTLKSGTAAAVSTTSGASLDAAINGQQPVKVPRPDVKTLSERVKEEMPNATVYAPGTNNGSDHRHAKIKYRASNPFKDPKTFVLTGASLFGLLLPRVILPGLAIFLVYQGGTFFYHKYQASHSAAAVPVQPFVHPVSHSNIFPKAKPKVAPAATSAVSSTPAVQETAVPVHHADSSRPRTPPRHEAPKHPTAAASHAKPEAAVKPAPASNEPIPEYKGPSSATGEPTKHRHAYQTVPTE